MLANQKNLSIKNRHTGDTGIEQENDYYEPRTRYSLSDMITQIKRSIPDLRSIKHQPLENKESPTGSPKHPQSHRHHLYPRPPPPPDQLDAMQTSSFDKENDAVTLSAIQSTSCTCGTKGDSGDSGTVVAEKNAISDDPDAYPMPHSSGQLQRPEVR